MSISGVGGGSRGGGFSVDGGMGEQGNQGNIVKETALGQQQGGALDPETLTKMLAQMLAKAGRIGGSPDSGDSSGGDEDNQRQQMSGQQQQGVQMPPENNNSVNFG